MDIVRQCKQEFDNAMQYKQGRISDWQANENLYYGRTKKPLKGRFNVPLPVMSGFIDTLLSKIDEPPILKYRPASEADFRATQKVQAFWDSESKREDNDFDSKDIDGKKLACFYGRAIFKTFAESDPKFKFYMIVTDPYDFYVDPVGGGNLEQARYMGEDNVYKSKSQLKAGADSGLYEAKYVEQLINGIAPNTIRVDQDQQNNKANRFSALGLSNSMYNFQGEGMMRFIESGTIIEGVRYYVLWNYETGVPIRCLPLKEVFESELWWWVSWATNRDPFNFWSKSPADDIRPIAEAMKILANQELDNRQKNNWGQRAFDPDIFENPAELEYKPDGLVSVKAGSSRIQEISRGIYEFKTPQLDGTINLVNWLDNFAGQKTGITADTQGQSEQSKVGIYEGNIQQVADRLGLYNKSYVKCHAAIGRRFVWGTHEHLNTKQAVKMIGENGVEWDYLKGREVNPDMDINVESSGSELQLNEAMKVQKANALEKLSNPLFAQSVNKKWLIEQILLTGGYSDEEVRVAQDIENNGNREVLARASEAIEDIVKNPKKMPKLFRGATTGFQSKIVNFAMDNTDGNLPLFNALMDYAMSHSQIVADNVRRRALQERAKAGLGLPTTTAEGGMQGMPPQMGNSPQEAMPMPQPEMAIAGSAPIPVQF